MGKAYESYIAAATAFAAAASLDSERIVASPAVAKLKLLILSNVEVIARFKCINTQVIELLHNLEIDDVTLWTLERALIDIQVADEALTSLAEARIAAPLLPVREKFISDMRKSTSLRNLGSLKSEIRDFQFAITRKSQKVEAEGSQRVFKVVAGLVLLFVLFIFLG
tara:strand:+ start:3267 stop:3767 length:501 start_codon:yes stop_codon:yes gene_type:complete